MAKKAKRVPPTGEQDSGPSMRGLVDIAEYRRMTGEGDNGGGFSDLGGFTDDLDLEFNDPPPWLTDSTPP